MAKRVFRDYMEVDGKLMEGFTVTKVSTGINAEDSGMMLELERQIDNVTIGVDVVYNPDCEDGETSLMVSGEYVKYIIPVPKEPEKKACGNRENRRVIWRNMNEILHRKRFMTKTDLLITTG